MTLKLFVFCRGNLGSISVLTHDKDFKVKAGFKNKIHVKSNYLNVQWTNFEFLFIVSNGQPRPRTTGSGRGGRGCRICVVIIHRITLKKLFFLIYLLN